MAGSGGRHARPDEPDDADVTGDTSGVTPATQPLPLVRREGPESRHVRAVAKRVPSALPALGRDEISDLPPSVRAAVDRRRRARESAAGAPPSESAAGAPPSESATGAPPSESATGAPPSETATGTPPSETATGAPPSETAAGAPPSAPAGPPPSATAAPSSAAVPPPTPVVPRQRPEPEIEQTSTRPSPGPASLDEVELVPVGSRARAVPRTPEPPPPEAVTPTPGPATWDEATTAGGHRTPYAQGGTAVAPPEPPPAVRAPVASGQGPHSLSGRQPQSVEAEIVDDRPPPYVAPDAQTDEWVTVPPAPSGLPRRPAGPAPAGPPPAPLGPPPVPLGRPPAPLGQPPARLGQPSAPVGQPPAPPSDQPPAAPSRPLVVPSRPREMPAPPGQAEPPELAVRAEPPEPAGPPTALPPRPPVGQPDTWETAPLPPVTDDYQGRRRARRRTGRLPASGWLVVLGVVIALSAAVAVPFLVTAPGPSPSANTVPTTASAGPTSPARTSAGQSGVPVIVAPSADASSSPSAGPSAAPSQPPLPAPGGPPAPSPFALTLQAEATSNAIGGGATRTNGVVDYLGDWPNRSQDGWLEFRNITVPQAGSYQLKVYHRYENYCGCDPRRLEVWVNGQRVRTWDFTSPNDGVKEVSITLGAGNNTIRLTHPTSASPAIDRIEITRR